MSCYHRKICPSELIFISITRALKGLMLHTGLVQTRNYIITCTYSVIFKIALFGRRDWHVLMTAYY
jgi:hypothetical protein